MFCNIQFVIGMDEFVKYKCFHCPFQGSFYHLCLKQEKKKESPTFLNAMCAYIEQETDYLWIRKRDGSNQKYLIQTKANLTYLGSLDRVLTNTDLGVYEFETFQNYQVECNNVQSHLLEVFQEYLNKDLLNLIATYLPDERKLISTIFPVERVRFLKHNQLVLYSLLIGGQSYNECYDLDTGNKYRLKYGLGVPGAKKFWTLETMWHQETKKQFTFHIGPSASVIICEIDVSSFFTFRQKKVKLLGNPFSMRVWCNYLWVLVKNINSDELIFQILRFYNNSWEIYTNPPQTNVICPLQPNSFPQLQFAVHMVETESDIRWQAYIVMLGWVHKIHGGLNLKKDWIPANFHKSRRKKKTRHK